MKILILGANGFIGSAVASRLLKDGHAITGLARSVRRAGFKQPDIAWISADLARMTTLASWHSVLLGMDVVVNCAGALQDGLSDDLVATQEKAMHALYAAAKAAGIRRIVQTSARTDGAAAGSAFLSTKRNADQALAASGVPFVILRPALVIGRNAHGGTALIRALAALPPVIPLIHADNVIETISMDDVTSAVSSAVSGELGDSADIELYSSQPQSLAELIQSHRRWLGLPPARIVALPAIAALPVTLLADIAGRLGWRSPLRSTAMAVMSEGVLRSASAPPLRETKCVPAADFLAANPSGVQDLWAARLYLLKPAMIATLSLFWLLSGLIPLAEPSAASHHFLPYMSPLAASVILIASCLLDIILGVTVLFRPFAGKAMLAMVATSMSYLLGGSILEPALWLDPLGPLVKVLPSILLTLASLAIIEER